VVVVGVGHVRREPVQLRAPAGELQIAEHVVERPVLQHQDDDVVDAVECLDRSVDFDLDPCHVAEANAPK
jgi:hypothetical protein